MLLVVASLLLTRTVYAEILDEKRFEQAILNLPNVKLDSTLADQLITEALKTDLDPFVLIAQLYIESRFDPTTTSRLVDGTRRTGSWTSRRAPIGWTGNLYCGVAQTAASSWAACLALREPNAALAAQAAELHAWLQRTRGDLSRSLAGYGCGNVGVKTGRCNGYPRRVLALAQRLRRATHDVPVS